MARQYYNITGTNPVAGDQNPATALTRLRNLEAVDRYTGVNLVDPGATISYTNPGASQVDITFASGAIALTETHLIEAPGNYVFYNKTIVLSVDGAIRAGADGVHLYFVNCTIAQDAASGTNPRISTQQATNGGTTDSRVTNGAAAGRSVNFYGCTLSGPQAIQNSTFYISDIFNSTYISYQGRRSILAFAALGGSRAINLTVAGPSDDVVGVVVTYYGIPELFEGFAGSFSQIEATATFGQNQAILIEPNFTSLEAGQRYRMQQDDVVNRAFQIIGPYNPPGNVNDDTITSTDGTPYVWYAPPGGGATESTAGGVINYYGWQSGFFSDLAQEQGIQGVNVRIESNATLNNTTLNGATNGAYSTAISNQSASTVNLTGGAFTHITDYKTGTTGFPVVGTTSQSSVNGTTFTAGQWIDWLRLGVFDLDGYTTNPTTEVAQNFAGQAAPDGCVIAPISLVRNDIYNQFAARYQARGFTHQIITGDNQNGLLGTSEGNQTANSVTSIDTTNYIGANLVGVSVKSQNVSAGQPSISFIAGSPVSINDVRDAYRAGWYEYDYALANGDHTTPAINLVLSNVHTTDYTATAAGITVRANGIARDASNDLFTTDSLGTGDFGGGFLNSHTLTFSGAVTQLGDVVNSSITADSIAFTSFADVSGSTLNSDSITGALGSTFTNGTTATNNRFGTSGTIAFTGLSGSLLDTAVLGVGFTLADGVTVNLTNGGTAVTVFTNNANITGSDGVTIAAVPATATFTHDTNASGGNFAVFARTGDGVAWGSAIFNQTYAPSDPGTSIAKPALTHNITNPTGQYLSLWKPANATTYTRISFVDLTSGISSDTTFTAPTLSIAGEVLSGAAVPANTIAWTSGSVTDSEGTRTQIIGTISNTDTSANRLDNVTSQSVMLSALSEKIYYDLIIANVDTAGFIDLTESRADFIIAASATSTLADGTFLELTSAGAQQGMTAINQSSLTSLSGMLSAQIMGKEGAGGTGVDIQFAAVDIAGNPDGISAPEVRAALVGNQQVILTAVQRGALKAATYSAGSLEG